ncbi:MAG: hypothetical protein U0531_06315 [Dehalococcoidia bacterium]
MVNLEPGTDRTAVYEPTGVDWALVERARALALALREAGPRIDAERRLDELAAAMAHRRLLRPVCPRRHRRQSRSGHRHPRRGGGSPRRGSAGWLCMIAGAGSLKLGWLPLAVVRAMAVERGSLHLAGSARTLGAAEAVPGGYRVTGRWDFQSGINHAAWMYGICRETSAAGAPARLVIAPVDAGEIIDTWSVMGMRGTGSHDFALTDVFVPAERTLPFLPDCSPANPLFTPRLYLVWTWALNAAVGLGIGQGALDTFMDLAARHGTSGSTTLLRDRAEAQTAVGRAEAMLSAARAYVYTSLARAWQTVQTEGADPTIAIAHTRLAITHAVREALGVVDLLFHTAGTNAIYARNRLERSFRDIHVAVQHGSTLTQHYTSAGRIFLGLAPPDRGW